MRKRLAIIASLVAVNLLAACGGVASSTPPPPIVPCYPGTMGASQRCPSGVKVPPPRKAPFGQTGIDLSNNNPAYGVWATIRHHASFAVFKVTEGTGYVDPTARRMAAEARAHGLFVGGYDFQHVCGDSAVGEANLFIHALRADGLLSGRGVLPPVADFELASGSCNAHAWLTSWSNTVRRAAGRSTIYSDPGFYGPELGCFTDASYGWVADLGGFTTLCRLATRFHQWSWTYFNGVSRVDGDVYIGSYASLQAVAHASVPPKPTKPKLRKLIAALSALLGAHTRHNPHGHNCADPPYRHAYPSRRFDHSCLVWAHRKHRAEHELKGAR